MSSGEHYFDTETRRIGGWHGEEKGKELNNGKIDGTGIIAFILTPDLIVN